MEEDSVVEVEHEEPPKKKMAPTPPVEMSTRATTQVGIHSVRYFKRCLPAGKYTDFDDIVKLIRGYEDDVQYIDGRNIQLYDGFVKALTNIITSIKDAMNSNMNAIVVHGTPGVGKSTLAKMLMYYICHMLPLGILTEFEFSPNKRDSEKGLRFVFYELDNGSSVEQKDVFYVFDGCDTQNLAMHEVTQHYSNIMLGKGNPTPYPCIFFTSGHFFPDLSWVNHQRFVVYVIHMVPQAKELSVRFCLSQREAVQSVLDIVPVYGQCCKILGEIVSLTKGEAKNLVRINLVKSLENIHKDKNAVLFLSRLWHGILSCKTLPQFKDIGDEYFKLDSFHHAEMSDFLQMGGKETTDKGLNALINWMIPGTEASPHSSENLFNEYSCDDVHFWMTNTELIYEVLIKKLHKTSTPSDLYSKALGFYTIDDEDTAANTRKGHALEILVPSYLKVKQERSTERKPFGFHFDVLEESVHVREVHQSIDISKRQEAENLFCPLLQGAVCSAGCHKVVNHTHTIWVNLVSQFKGYDAAEFLISVKSNGKVKEVVAGNLIQITQNLSSKVDRNIKIMKNMSKQICEQLVDKKMLPKGQEHRIKTFFGVPHNHELHLQEYKGFHVSHFIDFREVSMIS